MNKLMIIGGPTGVGKSDIAVRLALRYNGVIIGADSMQIYKGMDIGTAKIKEEEKRGIKHTMIDIVYPNVSYSVQQYSHDAEKCIQEAIADGKLPIVVGGTGLYLNALIHRQNFADAQPDLRIREKYRTLLQEHGAQYLHDMLRKTDPESAESISMNDTKRVIRALEIYEQTGKPKSQSVTKIQSDYDIRFYILEAERQKLYERINRRVEKMMQCGLVDEVQALSQYWDCQSMQAIGYKEIIAALRSGEDPEGMVECIQQNSRRYAKRQITFLKWIDAEKTYVSEDFYEHITAAADAWSERV